MPKFNSNKMCSVPQCTNRKSGNVSLHLFPLNKTLQKRWQVLLRIEKPITENMYGCSEHFSNESFYYFDPAIGKSRRLKTDAIPTKNLPVRSSDKPNSMQKTLHAAARTERVQNRNLNAVITKTTSNLQMEPPPHEPPVCPDILETELSAAEALLELQDSLLINCKSEKIIHVDIACQANELHIKFREKPTLMEMIRTDSDLNAFTGIQTLNLLNKIEECCNVFLNEKNNKCKLGIRSKIVLTMVKIKLNISFSCISTLFGLNVSTCTSYFYSMVQLLSAVLKGAIVWPSKEEVLCNTMPKHFAAYKNTRVVLDCTEVQIEKANCLRCRISTYSHYKGTNTIKVLIGTSPAGLITFCSEVFGGRASDKAITAQSKILDMLEPYIDAVMVDKGFRIDDECAVKGIKLIRPPFLSKEKQFSVTDGNKTADIARARVHVERAIQRIKIFNIIKHSFPWRLLPYADDIFTIACGIANLGKPILASDKF